ncbi:hypothetical protein K435DRAFT_813142 [Dendrothele bispora CBS 962.96]|uniref:CCHC-type domain-containing protein n=1 Tax=Dendrothele bispora (strain CBS 962.96) TaxID=1314807 RepID=A0A4V6T4V8_DENBC|nr:hypothetical protein K435DRAFT_813142 [Dendrothele bispora CBS 962.96]
MSTLPYYLNSPQSFLCLPPLGHREAPPKFKGQSYKIQNFIIHLERLFVKYNVTDGKDRCQALLTYSSRKVRELVEASEPFRKNNWNELVELLKEIYDAKKKERKYKPQLLRNLTDEWKYRDIKNISSFLRYVREFLRISGPLVHNELITSTQESEYFFHGLSKSLRKKLTNRLREQEPYHDMSIPWDRETVQKTAIQYFKDKSNEFTKFLDNDDSDLEISDYSDSDSDNAATDVDSDSSSDESDSGKRKSSKSKTKKKSTKKSRKSESKSHDSDISLPSTPKSKSPSIPSTPASGTSIDPHLDELVEKLSRLNIQDSDYALTYYRAIKQDPEIKNIFPAPSLVSLPPLPPNNFRNNQYVAPPANSNAPREQGDSCYGCGSKEHLVPECKLINDVIAAGHLKRGRNNPLFWPSGAILRRKGTETLIQAFERQKDNPPQQQPAQNTTSSSNLVQATISPINTDSYVHLVSPTATDEEIAQALEVHRDKLNKGKNRSDPYKKAETDHHTRSKGSAENIPLPKTDRNPKQPRELTPAPPLPVDPNPTRFNPTSDDTIMEDLQKSSDKSPKSDKKRQPGNTRQSELSASVDKDLIVNRLLNSSGFSVTMGELLACSPDIANKMMDMIKFKNAKTSLISVDADINWASASASSFLIDRHMLIRLQVTVEGREIDAIVDTGSMLNIVRQDIWRNKMGGRAMDITKSMGVHDANGGKGILQGRVDAVPIQCGSVKTYANLFVGSHVPFDLLLGRPWQRGNFVSIDERDDGTYLLFKRRTGNGELRVQYEIRVEPEEVSEEWSNSISSFIQAANQFSVTTDAELKIPGSFLLTATPIPITDGYDTVSPNATPDFRSSNLYENSTIKSLEQNFFRTLNYLFIVLSNLLIMPIFTRAMTRSASAAIEGLLSIPHIINDSGEFITIGTPVSETSTDSMDLSYPDNNSNTSFGSMPPLVDAPEENVAEQEFDDEIRDLEPEEFYESLSSTISS